MVDRILCLANSYKHDNRCVAGISLSTNHWIRLVGNSIPGCLTLKEASYPDGTALRLLDIFEAELGAPCPTNCHPEDIHLTTRPIRFVDRFDRPHQVPRLAVHLSKHPTVLEGYSDRIYVRKIDSQPVRHSIELIRPEDLWWWIREETGKRKHRALFRVGRANRLRYDLAVTDPDWLDRLHVLPPGMYSHSKLCGGGTPKTLLTVSLSEPYDGFHYKLVAAVVVQPERRPIAAVSRTR
jgi:hypothetical protein